MTDLLFEVESAATPLAAARSRLARAHDAVAKAWDAGEPVTRDLSREVTGAELALATLERIEVAKRK